MDLVVN